MTTSSGDQAVRNGRAITRYDQGYCQKYVRDPCWGVPSLYGSAIDAWNGARDKHPGDRNPPRGAPCYYRGGQYGHAVIATDPGRIRSTDCTSATFVNDAPLSWPESAWGYEYLGWTGDINGVTLPLDSTDNNEPEDEDMPLSEEDLQKIAARVNKALGDYNNSGEPDPNNPNPDTLEQRVRQIEDVVRKILAKL